MSAESGHIREPTLPSMRLGWSPQKHPDVEMDLAGPQGDYPIEEACDLKDRATLQRTCKLHFQKKHFSLANLFRRPSKTNRYLEFLKSKLSPEPRQAIFLRDLCRAPGLRCVRS